MDDASLVIAFETCDPALDSFTHEDHLRVAFWYVAREPLGHAAERFKAAIRSFAQSRGKPDLYHETITWAYLVLLRGKLEALGPGATFDDVKRRWPDLLDHRDGELKRVYSDEELRAPEARRVFCLPRPRLARDGLA